MKSAQNEAKTEAEFDIFSTDANNLEHLKSSFFCVRELFTIVNTLRIGNWIPIFFTYPCICNIEYTYIKDRFCVFLLQTLLTFQDFSSPEENQASRANTTHWLTVARSETLEFRQTFNTTQCQVPKCEMFPKCSVGIQ